MDKGFGGAMLFSLNNDDYDNNCFQKPFPLLRVLNYHLSPSIPTEFPYPYIFYDEPLEEAYRDKISKSADDYFKTLTGPLVSLGKI